MTKKVSLLDNFVLFCTLLGGINAFDADFFSGGALRRTNADDPCEQEKLAFNECAVTKGNCYVCFTPLSGLTLECSLLEDAVCRIFENSSCDCQACYPAVEAYYNCKEQNDCGTLDCQNRNPVPAAGNSVLTPVPAPITITRSPVEYTASGDCTEEENAFSNCIVFADSCRQCLVPALQPSLTCSQFESSICAATENPACQCSQCIGVIQDYYACQTGGQCGTLPCQQSTDQLPTRQSEPLPNTYQTVVAPAPAPTIPSRSPNLPVWTPIPVAPPSPTKPTNTMWFGISEPLPPVGMPQIELGESNALATSGFLGSMRFGWRWASITTVLSIGILPSLF